MRWVLVTLSLTCNVSSNAPNGSTYSWGFVSNNSVGITGAQSGIHTNADLILNDGKAVTILANASPLPLASDATLKNLTVNGTGVTGFSANTYTYNITLPAGSAKAPIVTAVVNDSGATDVVTQAANSLGTATMVVTAQNGTTRNTYTLNFKPSDLGQCNFNGNVFSCASNSDITVSPTSLPNATVGISYSQSLTISDPGTSSQNFRWNIISGSLPPGLSFAFSPTQAIQCSGTYCFFTQPPSGVLVPSNSPGTFFGTPTVVGTYSFTLQAIDNLNYTALPRFTITVASSTTSQ